MTAITTTTTTTTTGPRTLHLVDLENLLGDPRATGAPAARALDRYFAVAGRGADDIVYVAVNPPLALEVKRRHPDLCVHAVRGSDGAERWMLANSDPRWVASRFDRLVGGSGDWRLADRLAQVRELGLDVLTVSRRRSLSRLYGWHDLPVRYLDLVPDGRADR